MSRGKRESPNAYEKNASNRPEGSTPEAGVSPAVANFGQVSRKKMLKKYVRSRNVYENKGTQDTMSE